MSSNAPSTTGDRNGALLRDRHTPNRHSHSHSFPRRIAYLLLAETATYTPKQQHIVETLFAHDEQIKRVADAAQHFLTIVRERKVAQLGDWVVDGQQSHIRELIGFARGIDADYDAVRNALVLPYSNGVVEGINTRIKLVKRSMYGRAKLDLLRARVLAA